MRDWIAGLIGAAVIIAAALLISAWPAHAACPSFDALQGNYGSHHVDLYLFDDASAVSLLVGQITTIAGGPPPRAPVLVIVGDDHDAARSDFWLFDGNACLITGFGPFGEMEMSDLLMKDGLTKSPALQYKGPSI